MNSNFWIGVFVLFGWPILCTIFRAPSWFMNITSFIGGGIILYLLGYQ